MTKPDNIRSPSARPHRAPTRDFYMLCDYKKRHRARPTRSEEILWQALRGKQFGMNIRRQYLLGRHILDFYIPSLRINIEVDGASHETRSERDRVRDQTLRKRGVLVLRLAAELVETDLPAALGLIVVEIARASRLRGAGAARQ